MKSTTTFNEIMKRRVAKEILNLSCASEYDALQELKDMDPLDYSILFYMFTNYIENESKGIYPTTLMWKLNLYPSRYRSVRECMDRLYQRGFIIHCQPRTEVAPQLTFWLTEEGLKFMFTTLCACRKC